MLPYPDGTSHADIVRAKCGSHKAHSVTPNIIPAKYGSHKLSAKFVPTKCGRHNSLHTTEFRQEDSGGRYCGGQDYGIYKRIQSLGAAAPVNLPELPLPPATPTAPVLRPHAQKVASAVGPSTVPSDHYVVHFLCPYRIRVRRRSLRRGGTHTHVSRQAGQCAPKCRGLRRASARRHFFAVDDAGAADIPVRHVRKCEVTRSRRCIPVLCHPPAAI